MADKHYDWKPAFLSALRDYPVIRHACDAVGVNRSTAWRARQADPEFATAWDDALEEGIDRAEQEAFRRAVVGYEEPVVHQGRLQYVYERYVDGDGEERYRPLLDANAQPIPLTVRKHSDALLALVLKGRRKAVYAERRELTGADGAALPASQVIIATGVPTDDDHSDLA
jgi:hypothetical protein